MKNFVYDFYKINVDIRERMIDTWLMRFNSPLLQNSVHLGSMDCSNSIASSTSSKMTDEDEESIAARKDEKKSTLDTVPMAAQQTAHAKASSHTVKKLLPHRSKFTNKKKTKKPKDMPRRPLSAYNIFFRDERARILEHKEMAVKKEGALGSGSSLFSSLGKEVAKRWKMLKEKDRVEYTKMAEKEMARYRNEMDEYHIGLASKRRLEQNSQEDLANLGCAALGTQRSDTNYRNALPPLTWDTATARDIRTTSAASVPRSESMFDYGSLLSNADLGLARRSSSSSIDNLMKQQNAANISSQQNHLALSNELLLHQIRQSEQMQGLRQSDNIGSLMGFDMNPSQELLQLRQLRRLEDERNTSLSRSLQLESRQTNQSTVDPYLLMLLRHQAYNTELGAHRPISLPVDSSNPLLGISAMPHPQIPLLSELQRYQLTHMQQQRALGASPEISRSQLMLLLQNQMDQALSTSQQDKRDQSGNGGVD
jgi:HMG-box domain